MFAEFKATFVSAEITGDETTLSLSLTGVEVSALITAYFMELLETVAPETASAA